SCVYMGCSTHQVPSLSKVAMRSAAGTKSDEPARVTAATNSKMDCLERPSFQEGSGSVALVCANPRGGRRWRAGSAARVDSTMRRLMGADVIAVLLEF